VEYVVSANNNVLVSAKTAPNSYDLYTDISGAFSLDSVLTGYPSPFIDAAYDTTDYWITDGLSIYSGTEDAWTEDEPSTSGTPTGIYYSTLYSQLYAAFESTEADSSEVFINNGTWGGSADTSDLAAPTDFAELSRDGNDIVILGSVEGYYETATGSAFATPDPDNILTTNQNYLNIELKDAIVRTVFVDGDLFFAGTVGNGLWKNTGGVWARE
jgi:hypothetical protein